MTEATNRPVLPAPAPVDDSSRPYSSVSYLAIGGFILGVAYAAVMTIGVVIALLNRTPWILPPWSPGGVPAGCGPRLLGRPRSHSQFRGFSHGCETNGVGSLAQSQFRTRLPGAYYSACYLSVT